jgi:glucokinase
LLSFLLQDVHIGSTIIERGRRVYLGIDLGGTTGRVAIFERLDDTEEIDRRKFWMTKYPHGDFEKDFANLKAACRELIAQHGQVEAVGFAAAGVVDKRRTMLIKAGNITHWEDQPVALELSVELGCPVILGNDAEAAALAEAFHDEVDSCDFWFIVWGTGVGGCLVRFIDGKPVTFPGEFGHVEVDPHSERICPCGQRGCLQAYCGGAGIRQNTGQRASGLSSKQWRDVVGWMKVGVRGVLCSQPTLLVVFGGGIACKQTWLLDELESRLDQDLRIVNAPEVRRSVFGESAGLIGALSLIRLG